MVFELNFMSIYKQTLVYNELIAKFYFALDQSLIHVRPFHLHFTFLTYF